MPKSSYSAGARKALAAMVKRYGSKRGTAIFYAKANKVNKAKMRPGAKASQVYKKGGKQGGKRKKR